MKNFENVRNYQINEKFIKVIDVQEMKIVLRINNVQGDG